MGYLVVDCPRYTDGLISYPAWNPADELDLEGVVPALVRFSVGQEDPLDLIEDIDQALDKI